MGDDMDKKNPGEPASRPEGTREMVLDWLHNQLINIEKHVNKDVLTIYGDIGEGVDTRVRAALESMDTPVNNISQKRTKPLLVILTTDGGSIEITKVISNTLRHFYDTVHFLVPVKAMSAGTVLTMSGDAIYMDYFSRLGPIDPQILKGGMYIPALSYLHQYEKMREKAKKGELTSADLVLLQKLDLAELHSIELYKEMSVDLITEWLSRYKFKDWQKDGVPRTDYEKRARAEEIANKLNAQDKWFIHGHGIHMDVLRNELKLKIDDYSSDSVLKSLVWKYWWMVFDNSRSFVHSRNLI